MGLLFNDPVLHLIGNVSCAILENIAKSKRAKLTKQRLPDEGVCVIKENDIIMYTVQDIRKIFRCSQHTAYSLVNANGFPVTRIGGKLLVEKRALEHWLDRTRGKEFLL